MAALGHPIVGDHTYGIRSAFIDRQALHAATLGFRHPEDERALRFEAPLPSDMQALITVMRERPASPTAALRPSASRSARLTRHRARLVR